MDLSIAREPDVKQGQVGQALQGADLEGTIHHSVLLWGASMVDHKCLGGGELELLGELLDDHGCQLGLENPVSNALHPLVPLEWAAVARARLAAPNAVQLL